MFIMMPMKVPPLHIAVEAVTINQEAANEPTFRVMGLLLSKNSYFRSIAS